MDCSLPGSSIHVIFQARVLEWDAIASSADKGLKCVNDFTNVRNYYQYSCNLSGAVTSMRRAETRDTGPVLKERKKIAKSVWRAEKKGQRSWWQTGK